jgi:hypothetical protein
MVGGGKVAFTSAPPLCRFDPKLLVRRGRIADQQAGRAGLSGVPGSGRGYSCAWWWSGGGCVMMMTLLVFIEKLCFELLHFQGKGLGTVDPTEHT